MGQAHEMMQFPFPSQVRLGSQLLIKARTKQHHGISILLSAPKIQAAKRSHQVWDGGEAARARDAERHMQAQERRWGAAFTQPLSWLFITPKPC